jgi:FixJ family two-component response regulator
MAKAKYRVCLVDDDAAVRESVRLGAKAAGYDTVSFGNAQEFLSGFEPQKTCCLILDVRLPGINGLELLEILQARKTRIPCGQNTEPSRKQDWERGFRLLVGVNLG